VTDDELEQRLRRRPAPPLPSGLRGRVLATAGPELARPARSRFAFAAGLAAAALFGLHLAALAADVTAPLGPRFDEPAVAARAARIQALLPELSPDEARLLAVREQAAPGLRCPWLPTPPGGP
jgi:hypothetical protein